MKTENQRPLPRLQVVKRHAVDLYAAGLEVHWVTLLEGARHLTPDAHFAILATL
jgi:hypothetical protein